jgi:hypothetical protein
MSSRTTTPDDRAERGTTTMRMKTTTAFRAYTNIRARQTIKRIAATVRFMVKSVNKDGGISRARPNRYTWLRDAFVTAEEKNRNGQRPQRSRARPLLACHWQRFAIAFSSSGVRPLAATPAPSLPDPTGQSQAPAEHLAPPPRRPVTTTFTRKRPTKITNDRPKSQHATSPRFGDARPRQRITPKTPLQVHLQVPSSREPRRLPSQGFPLHVRCRCIVASRRPSNSGLKLTETSLRSASAA